MLLNWSFNGMDWFPLWLSLRVAFLSTGIALLFGIGIAHTLANREFRGREILDAAVKKDLPRLDSYHLYGPKFSKFSPETPGLQDAAMARKGEHDGLLGANGLTMRADDLRIDLFGNVAITTFILHYSFKTGTGEIKKQARTTMVFVKDRGAWKIAHEHLSAVPSS
jgi:hypothetical protein